MTAGKSEKVDETRFFSEKNRRMQPLVRLLEECFFSLVIDENALPSLSHPLCRIHRVISKRRERSGHRAMHNTQNQVSHKGERIKHQITDR